MCLYTTLRKNRKYVPNKKNGGNPPAVVDKRTELVPTKCGNCIECRKANAREWAQRLMEDIKEHKNGQFVTLTFSNEAYKYLNEKINKIGSYYQCLEGYERDNAIATHAVRLFNERWRKKYKKALRHWLVTELGQNGTENIHLHGIIYTDNYKDIEKIWNSGKEGPYGFVWDGYNVNGKRTNYVNSATINYMVKYISKIDKKHKEYKAIKLNSPGIGKCYTTKKFGQWEKNKFNGEKTDETYRTESGTRLPLTTYWKRKIYTDEEREKLWIQKLDKGEKYVCGEKVKPEEYDKTVEYYRKRNKELGYGSDKKEWSRKYYESQRRIQMNNERLKDTKKKPTKRK